MIVWHILKDIRYEMYVNFTNNCVTSINVTRTFMDVYITNGDHIEITFVDFYRNQSPLGMLSAICSCHISGTLSVSSRH